MAEIDRQLVQRIADEVLAALNGRASATPDAATPIRPPIGQCTGDYSKFPELRGTGIGAPAPTQAPSPAPEQPAADEAPALKGFVTAEQLRAEVARSRDGVVVLAADAKLTPLANDLVREQALKIRRLGSSDLRHAAASDVPWLWWADGFCPSVQGLTTELRGTLLPITSDRSTTGLVGVVRDLAKRVREKRATGGVLFVRSGALAMCYANRCRSLRAVLGTCEESVAEGVRDLAANVLVIEYPHTGAEKMRNLVTRFVRSSPKPPLSLDRELRELGECG